MDERARMIRESEQYLQDRKGAYSFRWFRYNAAWQAMQRIGLDDRCLICDVGAGWTELDYFLRKEKDFLGRYWPVDAGLDGTDLNKWTPPRGADYFVALEVLEHLFRPGQLVHGMQHSAQKAVIVTVPNPETTDVIGMDRTHVTVITKNFLEDRGFRVEARSHYGREADSLFAVWEKHR